MPTEITKINSAAITFETVSTDKIGSPNFGSTKLLSAGVIFETIASDRKFLETTILRSVGITFEYNLLYIDEIYLKNT
jgi:hypothetical protein